MGIRFGANIVNTFEGEYPAELQENIGSNSENLYLEGGEGMIGVIELFNDGDLEDLKSENLIVNEANLEFYINKDLMNGATTPKRLYLYDINNNSVLVDYGDLNSRSNDPLNARTIFSSLPETNESTGETKYTLRITQHVINLIENGTTNVRLGVVVTSNIEQLANVSVRESTPELSGDNNLEMVPASSTITPEGVVFYGSNASNEDTRLKLRVYYTSTDL